MCFVKLHDNGPTMIHYYLVLNQAENVNVLFIQRSLIAVVSSRGKMAKQTLDLNYRSSRFRSAHIILIFRKYKRFTEERIIRMQASL